MVDSLLGSGGGLFLLLHVGDNLGLGVVVLFLGLGDLDEIGHDLLDSVSSQLGGSHDLDLETEDTLTELNRADSHVDEVTLGLTSGDLVTLGVFLGLGTLTTDLTGDHDFATDGVTAAHDSAEDVVSSHTDGGSGEELVLEGLDVGGGAERLLVGEWFDGKINLVVSVVEVVSLLDEGLDLLDLADGVLEEILALGGTDTDFSVGAGGTNFDTGVSLNTKSLLEELVELSLEDTIGNESLLGVDFLSSSSVISHFRLLLDL